MSNYCEDYPCCGHTPSDPCARQPYDEPGYYDTTRRGNEHALCDHEYGDCYVDEWDEEEEEPIEDDDAPFVQEDAMMEYGLWGSEA